MTKLLPRKVLSLLGLCAIALLFSGCVAGRRTVALAVPNTASTGTKSEITVTNVVDSRVFENKPGSPSIPSIDGDVTTLKGDEKSVFIGRQRNGYGKAMGDITLPANDSVKNHARWLVEEGLRRSGYRVVQPGQASADGVSVKINQFWAWFTPGMWSVSFEAKLSCEVTVTQGGATKTFVVDGYGKNQGQVASDENWRLAYDRAFADFLVHFEYRLKENGL